MEVRSGNSKCRCVWNDVAKITRIVRSRLCLRGFKDIDRDSVAKYAGTSTRHSQRLVCSEAVLRKWDMATTDISKAFLQGVTYKELAELTGEPLRVVHFDLPAYCIPFLRKVPGYEDYDPRTEVLHCDKPGTGCNDAPRCLSLKLAKVTKEMCGMTQCGADGELCFLYKDGKLLAVMTKHVDDLKIAGDRPTIVYILKCIEKIFGELKILWNNFTNCGVRHFKDPITKEITLDQNEYVKGIKTVAHPEMSSQPSDALCGSELHMLYWSVIGALNFAILTRMDIAVFVSALQRVSHQPTILHCKRLNTVVRWAQRNPKHIRYTRLGNVTGEALPGAPGNVVPTHLRMYSDAAFKKEEEDGHSLRGACYLRCYGNQDHNLTKATRGHLIDFQAKGQRRVVRATFTAELLGGCDTIDKGILLAQTLHELQTGIVTACNSVNLRDNGGYAIPMVLYIDALSVYAAIIATFIKTPADQSVLCHLQYIHELLDHDVLRALVWLDTRDMIADGMTKGSIDRFELHQAMEGIVGASQECKIWRPKHFAIKNGEPPKP